MATVVVVDASDGDETENLCREMDRTSLDVLYHRAKSPSSARQRNEGADICRELGVEVIHFLDDDTDVKPGYLDAIEARFADDPALAGVGAIIENQPKVPLKLLKRIFALWGHPGSILRSGCGVNGQFPSVSGNKRDPEWLCGCAMSYRATVFERHRFDERQHGYSLGEDIDFGFRVSRTHRLAVEPSARCFHQFSLENRLTREKYGHMRTVMIYCWVREHRSDGMSLLAFWWSVLGDLLLHAAGGIVVRRRGGGQYAKGIIRGIATIAAGHATRSAKWSDSQDVHP